MVRKVRDVYPNEYFNTGDEYHAFGLKYGVWGREALILKKRKDKESVIPEPKIFKREKRSKKT